MHCIGYRPQPELWFLSELKHFIFYIHIYMLNIQSMIKHMCFAFWKIKHITCDLEMAESRKQVRWLQASTLVYRCGGLAVLKRKAFPFVFWYSDFHSLHQNNKSLLIFSGEWKNFYINEFCALASKPFYKDGHCFSKHILFLFFLSALVYLYLWCFIVC